jgi:hypothetical protein
MKKEIFKDKDSLKIFIDKCFDDRLDTTRMMIEQIISRNILYYIGEQYLEYLPSTGQFRRRTGTAFLPTPVSNLIREFVRSVVAMLMNQKMSPRVWPNTNEKEDVQASDAGQALLVSLDQANDACFFDEKEKLAIMICLSGTAFMRTYADANGGVWLPDGSKTGDVADECILPFNVRLDSMGDKLKDKRWLGIQSLKDKEWTEDTYKVKIENNDESKAQIDYQRYLSKLVQSVSPWKGRPMVVSSFNSEEDDDNLVMFREIEFKPTKEHPFGYYAVCCGGKVIYQKDRMPIRATDEEWYYSLTDFHYNYVPGRFWSDPGVNDLISPQNIINEIDQSLAINRKGMGRPKVITTGEIGLKKIGLGGHGFLALQYSPIMGQKPDFVQGTPLPVQVLEERSLQKAGFQDASGDPKNVLQGQQPSANASGILTEGLRETAERGRYPDLERFNRSLTRVYKKRLLVAQEVYTEERLIKTLGLGNKVKITKFKASDLRGNTDVRLELDSGLIGTKSGQAQMLINMIQAGFFKEGEIDPTLRQEVLQRMGMSTFTDEVDNDVERAEAENVSIASGEVTVMLAEQQQNPQTGETEDVVLVDDPMFKYDNHGTHYEVHRKFIISPEFRELPVKTQTIAIAHADLHKKLIDEQPPDIRDYVQIDKLLLPGTLKESERAQVVTKYLGITPGTESVTGTPDADTIAKLGQKSASDKQKNALKQAEIKTDFMKHIITETGKAFVMRNQKSDKGK